MPLAEMALKVSRELEIPTLSDFQVVQEVSKNSSEHWKKQCQRRRLGLLFTESSTYEVDVQTFCTCICPSRVLGGLGVPVSVFGSNS